LCNWSKSIFPSPSISPVGTLSAPYKETSILFTELFWLVYYEFEIMSMKKLSTIVLKNNLKEIQNFIKKAVKFMIIIKN